MTGDKMKNLIKKLVTLLTLSSILLPQLTLAANTHYTVLVRASSQYFTAADSADVSITGNQTYMMWLYNEADLGVDVERFIWDGFATDGNKDTRISYMRNGTGAPEFRLRTSSDCSAITETVITKTLTAQTWTHIAIVITSGTWELFVNGVSQGTNTASAGICNGGEGLWIGARSDGANSWNGQIDDFRIYNVAKTGAQILADYDTEICDFTNLKAYWKFNNDANEVVGVGANTDNLTAVNSPTYQSASLPFTDACAGGGGTTVTPTHPFIWTMF